MLLLQNISFLVYHVGLGTALVAGSQVRPHPAGSGLALDPRRG